MNFSVTKHRIASIDIFRALTMYLMLFVNDIPGLKDVPHWLMHAGMHEDMLGFSDTIFPAFLFCMGLSVPFAIQTRYRKGDSTWQVIQHIGIRTIALLVMGLFTLNCGGVTGGLSYGWFSLLMVTGFFLVWAVYPKAEGGKKYLFIGMKIIGIALLAYLAIQKGIHGKPFHIGWWGILGLIGWTYVSCAMFYLLTRDSLPKVFMAWLFSIGLCIVSHTELIPKDCFLHYILLPAIPGGWTHNALGMSGVLSALLMQRYAKPEKCGVFTLLLCLLGMTMLVCALCSHPHWIISKILATPTWLFYCLALFFPLLAFFYWLTDVKGKGNWFSLLKPAGTATLTCYIVPYVWYALVRMLHIHFPAFLGVGMLGLVKSLLFSLIIVQLTGLLVKANIKLKV